MYSPIPVYDEFCGFGAPNHEYEQRKLKYMLKMHILDKGLPGMSVFLHIHSNGGDSVIFLTIFIITNRKKICEESDNHRSRLMEAMTLCISLAPNRDIKQTLNELRIFLKTNDGTANNKATRKVHNICNYGLSSFDEANMFTLIGSDCVDENIIGDI